MHIKRLLAFALAGGCGGGHGGGHGNLPPAVPMITPDAWSGSLDTRVFTDENADPAIVEVSLTAAPGQVEYLPGKTAQVWSYNGGVPGPTLVANVGDEIIVHFTNDLPEPTTIHWHGVRVPADMDGTTAMMNPIPAGGTFEYRFRALDAGTFWYHPHVRSDVQVEKGLYGSIVIRDPLEPAIAAVAEEVLVLDDVLVDPETGALDETVGERAEMMGREGNLVLVNGLRSNLGIDVRAGERRRWRIVNAANSRYFKLILAGGSMTRLGGDGGLLAAPAPAAELLLVPGERADVVVSIADPSATATLLATTYERAGGAGATEPVDIVRLVAGPDAPVTPDPLPDTLRDIPAPGAPSGSRTVRLGERMEGDRMIFTINDAAFPDVPLIETATGAVETWTIVNETMMDHPFHLHGFFFQEEGSGEWKDTINIPADATVALTVDFASRAGAAGSWMYHCHILEHAEGGMMGEVRINAP